MQPSSGMGEERAQYDIVVIGGGSAGGGVAARLTAGGWRVLLVEQDRLGGECLNYGCIPTKALLRSAEAAHAVAQAAEFGVRVRSPEVVFASAMERVRRVIRESRGRPEPETWEALPFEAVRGHARFLSPSELEIERDDGERRRVPFERAVIATGGREQIPAVPGLDSCDYLTSDTIWDLDERPRHLVIVGGGLIGCEFAQIFTRLGTAVTLAESGTQLLDQEEPEVGDVIAGVLRDEGVTVMLETRMQRIECDGDQTVVQVSGERAAEIRGDRVLLATGREPDCEALGIDAAGVERTPKGIRVDDRLRTTADNIWACGDVIGAFPFVQAASYQAELLARNFLEGTDERVDYSGMPWATFTDPEIGRVGATEAQAREAGHDVLIGRADIGELARAITDSRRIGFAKLVANASDRRLLGAHIVSPRAGELIGQAALAMRAGVTVDELADALYVYPTYSEVIRDAARSVGR